MTLAHPFRLAVWLAVLVASLAIASSAFASVAARGGPLRVEPANARRGVLELVPAGASFTGELTIHNDGEEPLVVSRVAFRGEGTEPRAPAKVSVRLAEGVLPVLLPPGGSVNAIVTWSPDLSARVRQLFAHVIVESADDHAGEVVTGVHAQMRGPLGPASPHVLSLVVGLPLVGAGLGLGLRARGRRPGKATKLVSMGCLAGQTALAGHVFHSFTPGMSRLEGNDGLQLVERAVVVERLGLEVHLGVDGLAASALFVLAVIALGGALTGALTASPPDDASGRRDVAHLLLASAVAGVLVSMTLVLFVLFAAAAVAAAAALVDDGAGRRSAAVKVGLVGGVAVLFLMASVALVAPASGTTYLMSGSATEISFDLPELSRAAVGLSGATSLAGATTKIALVLVLGASVAFLAAFPLHGWLRSALEAAEPAGSALVAAALPTIGAACLLRLGCAMLPEGMRWASGVVVAVGAVTTIHGALTALVTRDLRRFAAAASVSQVGLVLVGVGSLTPQGLAAAVVLTSTRALACALFVQMAGAIGRRARTWDREALAGRGRAMPVFAALLIIASLGHAGAATVAGLSPVLAVFGAWPSYGPLAVTAALSVVALPIAHLAVVGPIVFGAPPEGGRLSDLAPREWLTALPVAALLMVVGLWPAPILRAAAGTLRDISHAVSPPGPDQVASVSWSARSSSTPSAARSPPLPSAHVRGGLGPTVPGARATLSSNASSARHCRHAGPACRRRQRVR
jgi:NADH-quinone oxidoreductase subunit M